MTFKELKNNILLALYSRYKADVHIRIDATLFCKENKIIYDNDRQLLDVLKQLKNDGYIRGYLYQNAKFDIVDITPIGIEYVEDNLLTEEEELINSLRDTDKMVKEGYTVDIESLEKSEESGGNEPKEVRGDSEETREPDVEILYEPTENYKAPGNENPCFGIDILANCYIRQLDEIAKHTNENFCMLGIFGSWGRGKTYFFNRIKKLLNERQTSKQNKGLNEQKKIDYKIVEFNAWKYQDTPAIWAYLYENLYSSLTCEEKFIFWWRSFWKKIFLLLVFLCIAWGLNIFISWASDISDNVKEYIKIIQVPLVWVTTISASIYAYINKPFTVQKQINNYIKRKSYNNILGIQNDLEGDIETLLKFIISKPVEEQLLLFVDDIDRCTSDKMIHIINSLRIILENREIQKRLIVICSIDSKKLKEGYCLYKGVERNDPTLLVEAKEHIDKLFIFSMGLPRIDVNQQLEYLSEITEDQSKSKENPVDPIPFSTYRGNRSFVATDTAETIHELDDTMIKEIMADFLKQHEDVEITPRKIRIMYYRLLFAKNIIAAGNGKITRSMVLQILAKSINPNIGLNIHDSMSDVIQTVVPY